MSDKAAQKENPELSGQKFLTKKVLSERMQSYGFAHYPYPVKCRALGLRQCHSGLTPRPKHGCWTRRRCCLIACGEATWWYEACHG